MSWERQLGLGILALAILVSTSLAEDLGTSWPVPSAVVSSEAPVESGCMLPGGCNSCTTPHLQFTADAVFLSRSGPDSGGLMFDLGTGEELLNLDDLGMSAEAGIRLGLICFDESGYDLELNYLGLDRFVTQRTRSSDDGIIFPFFGGFPLNPANTYDVEYASRLRSGEANLRYRLQDRVTLLAGFRVLELKEKFDITEQNGGFFSNTDNDLYGLQVGSDLILWTLYRCHLFSTLKAGVYYNNADVMATASGSDGQLLQFIDGEDVAAFVGDVTLGLLIPMGPRADLRIAYQGLYLDGVGLAPNQSDNYTLSTGFGSLDESTLYYHGGFLGVDFFF